MNVTEAWYVVKQTSGQCAIVPASQLEEQPQTDDAPTLDREWRAAGRGGWRARDDWRGCGDRHRQVSYFSVSR